MNQAMRSNSKRVYLRGPEPEDCDSLIHLYLSSREHFRGLTNANFDRHRFEQLLVEAAKDTNAYFLVCRVDDDSIIGSLNFSQIFRKGFQNTYLGYQLFAGFTGNGYMTEAVSLGLRYAFLDLKLHRVEANVQPSNKPSIAVLVRNGFAKEGLSRRYLKINGRWRDHERWAILKENWIARK
ncbi:MAG: N-acetyltransferase [Acidobacteria bacterium]|nr:MAG: N-acetyltransferase [Acidobacteriota bacterium]